MANKQLKRVLRDMTKVGLFTISSPIYFACKEKGWERKEIIKSIKESASIFK